MRIAIYHENCVQAGKAVGDRELEQAEADNEGCDCDPWEGADWLIHEGSPANLLILAADTERGARMGGGGQYDRRVADTIREAVYDAEPERRPIT